MKLDYDYIKQLLFVMENYEEHQIALSELMKLMQVESQHNNTKDNKALDKFIGHIKLLADNYFIDSSSPELGFKIGYSGNVMIGNALYRITSRGYEFIDMLKNDTVFQKIKNFAISNAWDIGKEILISVMSGKLNG